MKRAYENKNRKKGAERRKAVNQGLWVIDYLTQKMGPVEPPERAKRGHRKSPRPAKLPRRRPSSGRGISGEQVNVTGKKRTAPDELSGGRAKPRRETKIKRHPKRRHLNRR